jgi:hypothetical protein
MVTPCPLTPPRRQPAPGTPDAEALAGMQAKSEEFAAQGDRMYLPLAD